MRKRILAFTLVIFLLCFNVTTAELQAQVPIRQDAITDILVATGIVISSETALAYALGVLGFTAASVAIYDNRDSLIAFCNDVKKDFIDFCAKSEEWASVTSAKIEYWLEGIGTGVLDKADEVWSAFKDYCVNLKESKDALADSSDVPSIAPDVTALNLSESHIKELYSKYSGNVVNYNLSALSVHSSRSYTVDMFSSLGMYSKELFHTESDNTFYVLVRFNDRNHCWFALSKSFDSSNALETCPYIFFADSSLSGTYSFSSLFGTAIKWFRNHSGSTNEECDTYISNCSLHSYKTRTDLMINVDAPFLSGEWYYPVYGYLLSQYIFGELDFPKPGSEEDLANDVVIDGSINDVIERDGSLDNVDVVNPSDVKSDAVPVDVEGITMEDIAQPFPDDTVKTIDTSTDTVLPDNTPVDELPKDKDVSEFTIANLQKVFPFCIPWDLYRLYSTLLADAQAPKFVWKFPVVNDSGKLSYKELEIDLKDFDGVAKIVRTMELLAFMIFLTLKTRDLVRG